MSKTTATATRQSLMAMARQVLQDRPSIGIGISQIGELSARALHPGELAQMGDATPNRVMEFVAGRAAARAALGFDATIPIGKDRAPVWPHGYVGTITHGAGWAVAAAFAEPAFVGLDLEPDEDFPNDIWDIVLTPREIAWCREQPQPGRVARLVFSIKECAYKAQFARSRQVFGFERLEVTVQDGTFIARFSEDTGPIRKGSVLSGRYVRSEGIILTGIAL